MTPLPSVRDQIARHRAGQIGQGLLDLLGMAAQDQDFFLLRLGNRFVTAAFTFFCSAGVPFWATRARALRAWALLGIGYFRLPGSANDFELSFFRSLVLLKSLLIIRFPFPVAVCVPACLPLPL